MVRVYRPGEPATGMIERRAITSAAIVTVYLPDPKLGTMISE